MGRNGLEQTRHATIRDVGTPSNGSGHVSIDNAIRQAVVKLLNEFKYIKRILCNGIQVSSNRLHSYFQTKQR